MGAEADKKTVALPQARGGTEREPDKLEMREHLILSGQPVRTVVLPSGKLLPIYPKPQAYFYRIEEAIREYIEALATYDYRASRRLRWTLRWWRKARRRRAIDGIEQAKYRLLRLMLEDRYVDERNTDLTVDEFLGLPHDAVLHLLEGYREANDVEDILRRLIKNYPEAKKKDEQVQRAARHSGMRL
ncbi:MAG: hypothetical protein KJ954_14390 [Alphaproteobacteria bacterium]|nr:hypothetical protein [Alphaproteobacteria bacterium]